jgi:hypothetical protein
VTQPDILVTLVPFVEQLERLGVRYQIGGSVASSFYGVPRTTIDVDLVADIKMNHVDPLVAALEDSYYIDAEMIRDAIRRQECFNVIRLDTMLKLDVFVLKRRDFDQKAFGRGRIDTLEDTPDARRFSLTSPEDIILHKLEWYRLGGEASERQWGDLLGVLKVQAESIDKKYLRRWAVDLRVADLLERALREASEKGSRQRR